MIAAAEEIAGTTGVEPACRALGIARSSLYRSRRPPPKRAAKPPRPHHRALTPLEKQRVRSHLHEDRFVDQAPASIYATLLEEGVYVCSIRTMYRILEEQEEVRERRAQRRHPRRAPPRLVARAPNEVWTWDITKLAGPRKWTTFALYVILDMFSRYVVAWMVADRETAKLAKRLVREACVKEGIAKEQLTLHQDRGSPMTAKTFSQLLVDLDVLASYSRPRVSDDNPYSESHFKTVKYAPTYPGHFDSLEEARSYFGPFFRRYNAKHRHSGLGLMTPEAVHAGRAQTLQEQRRKVLAKAHALHPERFVHGEPEPPTIPTEVWINQPVNSIETEVVAQ